MKIFIFLNIIVFLFYGLGFIFFPEALILYVTDSIPSTTSGLIDIRATYGGMSVGFAILLFLISKNKQWYSLGTMASVLIVGGMALGRIVGIILDNSPNNLMYIYLILEVVVVSIGLFLLNSRNLKLEVKRPSNSK